jgi:hypothetical protein
MSVVLGREAGSFMVHRLVLDAFIGPCPDGHEGLHGLLGPGENALVNLKWGTRSQNLLDDYERGIRPKNKEHHWAGGLFGAALARVKRKEERNNVSDD